MRIIATTRNFIVCASLLAAGQTLAATRTWDGGGGTTVINTAANWSGDAVPSVAGDIALWDGTVQTNEPYVWSGGFGPGSGNTGATTFQIGSGYTSPLVLMNSGSGGNLSLSNIVIDAGAGPFRLGSNSVTSVTVFRGGATNYLINNSANPATIAEFVQFNNGGGASRTLAFAGSGDWMVNSPVYAAGSGTISIRVAGTGANTVTLSGAVPLNPTSASIGGGTMKLLSGDALAVTGTQTLSIEGGAGIKRLALANDISDLTLNAAIANINIAGRDVVAGAADAAIYNLSGNNSINGVVRFNATGGTNVGIHLDSGTLTFNGNLTAANVTGARYFNFGGTGTSTIVGTIADGSASLGLRLTGGSLVLNNANTHTGNTIVDGGVLTLGVDQALQNSTAVINGGQLDLNGGTVTAPVLGGLAGSGVVDTLTGGTIILSVGNNNASTTFSGTLTDTTGTINLQKVGNGTLTLAGANTYSGTTTVNAGTLLVSNTTGSGTGTGAVTVNSAGTFGGSGLVQGNVAWQSGAGAQFTVTPTTAVAGSNATAMTISGSLTLNGNSVVVNVAGGTPLQVGTYRLLTYNNSGSTGAFNASPTYTGAGVALGTASSITTSGGTVTLTVVFTGLTATWTNNGNGNWTVGANWSSAPAFPSAAGDAATLGVGAGFTTVTLNAPVSLGTLSFTNANSFEIADAGSALTFANNAGNTILSVQAGTSNAIAPAVVLNTNLTVLTTAGAAVTLGNSVTDGAATSTVNISGAGTIALHGNNSYGPAAGTVGTTIAGGVLQLGHNNALGAGDLNVVSSATLRAATTLTLPNNMLAGAGVLTVDNNANSVTLAGVLSGAGGLSKLSLGALTLSAANSYAGDTVVNDGTLRLGVAGAVPGGPGFGNVTVATNATFDLNGFSPTLNGLNGAGTVDSGIGGALVLTLGESGANGTFTGTIKNTAGTLALAKHGAGTQTLAGTNTYSGTTTISAGTLQIGNGGATGNLGSGAVVNDGTLAFNLTGTNIIANSISGIGGVTLANQALNLFLTGANSYSGNVTINGGHLWVNNSSALGTGPKTVVVTGGGVSALTTLHLSGNVTIDASIGYQLSYFDGAVANESGTNTLLGDIGMPFGGGAAYLNSKSGLLVLGGTISAINGGRTLQLGGAANGVVSGTISDGGAGGQIGAVQKRDAGTWTLSGPNTSVATATVAGGTLLLDGNWAGPIVVNTNATFGGSGAANQTVVWQAGAAATFTITPSGGANTTPLTVGGAVTLSNNAVTVRISGGTPLAPGSYTLMTFNPTGSSGSFVATPVITGAGIEAGTFATVVMGSGEVKLMVAKNFTWINNGNGNWGGAANWDTNPNVPSSPGDFATFGFGTSFTTVNLESNRTVGGVAFTNANSFGLTTASSTLTLNNSGNAASISVTDGTANSIAAPIMAADNVVITVADTKALALVGNISGAGALAKSGPGRLSLSGSNAYSGVTTLNAGVLALGSTNAISAGDFVISGGSLDSSVPNLVNANNNAQTWNASFGFVGSQNLNLGSGGVTMTANLTLTVSSNTLEVGGPVTTANTLTKAGAGTLVLGAPNSFTGVTINGGVIALGDDGALGTGPLVFNAGDAGIRSANATGRTIANNVTASFGGIYDGTGDLNFTGTVASGNFGKTFVVSNALTTFSGLVTDGGAPNGPNAKAGPGTLLISGGNTMTKPFRVEAGTLALGNSLAIGTGTLTLAGGGLDSTVSDLIYAGNNAQTWSGNFWFGGTENLDLGTGAVALTTNVTVTVSNKVLTVGGAVSGPTFAVTKAGAGKLMLNGANNYGNTTVQQGTLQIAQATLRTNSTVAIASGAVLQLDFATTNQVSSLLLNGVAQPNGVYRNTTPGGYLAGPGALKVVYLGPSAPVTLTNVVVGTTLSLTWPAGQGWRLEAQTNSLSVGLTGVWSPVSGAADGNYNAPIDATKPTVFYRLVYP